MATSEKIILVSSGPGDVLYETIQQGMSERIRTLKTSGPRVFINHQGIICEVQPAASEAMVATRWHRLHMDQ